MSQFDDSLAQLRAAAEPTRLRLLRLLCRGELTVTEATSILGQAQPGVSRHLKLLCEAGLASRHQDGAWVFYGSSLTPPLSELVRGLRGEAIDDDARRLDAVREERSARAEAYFAANAEEWDALRRLYLPDEAMEAAMLTMAGARGGRIRHLVDLGTGTGRMLVLFKDLYERATGYDTSSEMLGVARARLDAAGASEASLRRGDLTSLPDGAGPADLVVLHQVLHYLPEPSHALRVARGLLSRGGRLLVADFAPHDREELRERHAHRRLGFSTADIGRHGRAAGLEITDEASFPPTAPDGLAANVWQLRHADAHQGDER